MFYDKFLEHTVHTHLFYSFDTETLSEKKPY